MKSAMPRTELRRAAAAILLVLVAAFAAGCGGGGGKSDKDVGGLLDRAFSQSIKSADVKIDAQLQVDGLQGFEKPVRVQASGPYIGGHRGLPRLDIDLNVGAKGAGQTVQSGFLSTGDRAFVKFGGEFYEQPRASVDRANRQLRKTGKGRRSSLSDLGLTPRAWVVDAKGQDDQKVAGVQTEHVSGKLDVRRMFEDFNKLVQRSAGAIGGASPSTPEPLSATDLDRLSDVVQDPTFDVYVGKADNVIRRVSANLQITVPEKDRAKVNGIKGGSLRFTIELGHVNGNQTVEAPARSRPIADLTTQLGGAQALSGALGGSSGSDSNPGAGTAPGGAGGGGGSTPGSASPGTQGFQDYAQCLDKAKPGDTQAISRCRELLR